MDNILIELWNRRVTKNDQVYILVDFAFRNEKSYSWYRGQLKGQKHLIVGNHDKKQSDIQREKQMMRLMRKEENTL